MKRVIFAAAVAALSLVAGAKTIDVPLDGDVAAAVAAAEEGDVVRLAAGEYVFAAEVKIEAGVTVKGAGRFLTTVKSDGATHRLFYLNHDDAVLSDLTAQDAVTSGGAAVSVNKGTFQDAIVRNCRNSGYSGGVWILNGTVRRCVLTGNTSTDGGGGIYPAWGGTCRIESVLAYGNTASWGGGIYAENGSHPTIINCTFAGNAANVSGPDTYNYTGNNAKFVNTYRGVTVNGGVLDHSPDSMTADGFVAGALGVYHLSSGSPLLNAGSTADLPEADLDGSPMPATPSVGALQPSASPWIVPETASVMFGGSVGVTVHYPAEAAVGTGTLVVIKPDGTRSEIAAAEDAQVSFTADQIGGYSLMLVVEKDGVTVVRDLYNAVAAGVYDVYVNPNATNPVEPYLTPETAAATIAGALPFVMNGGTVWIAEGELTLSAEVKIEKAVTVKGAGRFLTTVKSDGASHRLFYLNDPGAVLANLTVKDAVTSDGTAVFVNYGTVQDAIVKNCKGGNGAGVYLENGTVRRCVLTGNSGNWGGGIYPHGTCRVESVLAYGNSAKYGGGIYTESSSHATIVNCTFAENSSMVGGDDIYNYTTATRVYNTYLGRTAGQGYAVKSASFDSNAFPGFVAANSGVFRLQPDSAMLAVGVAVPDADGGPAEADVDRNPLPATPSVGAFQPIAETSPIVPAAATAATGDPLGVKVNYPDGAKGGVGTLVLVNPDGTRTAVSAADGETAVVVPAQLGVHSLILKVEKDGATVVRDLYNAVMTAIGNVFVDPNASGSAEPYDTPETAAKTIEEAMPFVMNGGTVWIAEGEYPISKTLTVGRAVTIRGAGADKTTVVAAANVRLFALSHPGARIAGLTLRGTGDASADAGKGVYFHLGGAVEDCVFENLISSASGAAVACVDGVAGRIDRCIFRDNFSSAYGGGAYVSKTGRIDIRNSLFYGNRAFWGAGVYVDGHGSLVNCTFYDNLLETVSQGEFCRCNSNFGVTNCIFGTVCWYDKSSLNRANNLGSETPLADPGFRNAANRDYRLGPMATSAIDQGEDEVVLSGERDLLGRDRIGGEHVDLGCYEFYDDEFTAGFEIVGTATAAGDTVKLVPRLSGAADPTNSWRVVNLCGGSDDIVGETRGNGEAAAFEVEIPGPGVYSVRYSVVDGENAASLAKEEVFAIPAAGDVYVAVSAASAMPFDTPETAATNLTAAFRILPENATLHVPEGTYLVDRRLTVGGGRKVVGAGRDKTVLTPGLESTHGVFTLNSADSAITDLTITGASDAVKYADVKTGGGVLMSAGLLANVVMTNLVMANVYGSAIYATGGRISCVEMRGCTGSTADPGGVFLVGGAAAVDNTLVCDCEGGWGSTVYVTGGSPTFTNCTFVYRSGRTSGPMYSSSSSVKFVNCNFDCRVYMPSDRIVTDCFYGCNFSGTPQEEHFAENGNVNVASADILYADAANGNYRLKPKSPLAKAGLYDPSLRGTTDLDGRKRTTGGQVSIGCYQTPAPGLMLYLR